VSELEITFVDPTFVSRQSSEVNHVIELEAAIADRFYELVPEATGCVSRNGKLYLSSVCRSRELLALNGLIDQIPDLLCTQVEIEHNAQTHVIPIEMFRLVAQMKNHQIEPDQLRPYLEIIA